MRFDLITAVVGLLGLAAANTAHKDCEYSGVAGTSTTATGTCRIDAGRYGSGVCEIKGPNPPQPGPYECDYQWKNDIKAKTPCGDVKKSQFACKRNGNPCKVLRYAEDQKIPIVQCS